MKLGFQASDRKRGMTVEELEAFLVHVRSHSFSRATPVRVRIAMGGKIRDISIDRKDSQD